MGDVRTGADGKAHIGLRQRRGIVDAVAHHGHPLTLLLELGHALGLILRQHLCDDLIYADLAGNGVGGALVVAGEQHHSAAHAPQSSNGLGTVGFTTSATATQPSRRPLSAKNRGVLPSSASR